MTMHVATRRALLQSAAAGDNWWDIDGQTVVAAYQPIGADDLADSYINLANPGTYDAAPGIAPTWAAGTGWTFNGSTQYLDSGIDISDAWTSIIRYSGATFILNSVLYGASNITGTKRVYVQFRDTQTYRYFNGGYVLGSNNDWLDSAIVCVAGQVAYLDGSSYLSIPAGTAGNIGSPCFFGVLNNNDSPVSYFSGNIQAISIYSTTLSAGDVSTLTTAMNALS